MMGSQWSRAFTFSLGWSPTDEQIFWGLKRIGGWILSIEYTNLAWVIYWIQRVVWYSIIQYISANQQKNAVYLRFAVSGRLWLGFWMHVNRDCPDVWPAFAVFNRCWLPSLAIKIALRQTGSKHSLQRLLLCECNGCFLVQSLGAGRWLGATGQFAKEVVS